MCVSSDGGVSQVRRRSFIVRIIGVRVNVALERLWRAGKAQYARTLHRRISSHASIACKSHSAARHVSNRNAPGFEASATSLRRRFPSRA
jgi:hypothetical protein